MNKKTILAITAGVMILTIVITFGLLYFYSAQEPLPPVMAFASDRSGAGDIYGLDQDNQVVNLTQHPASDWAPCWSPDGQKLLFTSHRSGNSDIWLMTFTAPDSQAEPVNITQHPNWDYSAAWSPSEQTIVFVSERDGDPEIFVQNLESNTALQLTFNDQMDRWPTWSPDGKFIAFAAVRDGVEQIHLIRPDGTDEQIATPPQLKGTSPAWSPDGEKLAFIGWDDDNRAGIYTIGPGQDQIDRLYQGSSWLGSLHWSGDGAWLTFTSWERGNHELFALPATGGEAIRVTVDEAWDDALVINPSQIYIPVGQTGIAQAAPAPKLPPQPNLATGVNLADLGMAYLINDMGFDWGKGFVNWGTVEPEPGQYRWVDPDNVVKALGDQQVKILMRIHGTPAWARPANTSLSHPPTNMADFSAFMTALATRYKGQVAAYEIWNEPNLNYEWGNLAPNPAVYTEMLKAAYTAVKAVDPQALIISGGLSTTGNGSATAYGDLAFLQGMYDAGAKGYFDALGSHPYTFGRPPAEIDPWGLSFSRVADQQQVMAANGDGETPVWVTEVGWVLENSWDLGEHQNITVTEAEQAQYLTELYTTVQQNYPFVAAVFLFNLDFSTVPWYPAPEPMRWYAILNPDRTPRPAYTLLRQEMRTRP